MDNNDADKDKYRIENSISISAMSEGYLQTINQSNLLKIACENDIVIRMQYMPGDFVVKGNKLVNVWNCKDKSEELSMQILSCYAFGRERTVHQNILF